MFISGSRCKVKSNLFINASLPVKDLGLTEIEACCVTFNVNNKSGICNFLHIAFTNSEGQLKTCLTCSKQRAEFLLSVVWKPSVYLNLSLQNLENEPAR